MTNNSLPADYHTHTPLCMHAEGAPEAYVDRALQLGIAEYGVSDHAPQQPEPFDDWRMREDQLPEYIEWIERARSHANGSIPVRAGLECDWLTGNEPWIEKLTNYYDWDYLIGSVHYLGQGWDFDNPKWLGRWAEADVEQAWELYWREYAAMARSGMFDILAHPDLIKKFAYVPAGELNRFYEPAIEAIVDAGVAIELNMAGLYKPCEEAYPSPEFLRLAASANIPITLSSDAHKPEELGRDFDRGITMLKDVGYSETCLFEKRQATSRPIS